MRTIRDEAIKQAQDMSLAALSLAIASEKLSGRAEAAYRALQDGRPAGSVALPTPEDLAVLLTSLVKRYGAANLALEMAFRHEEPAAQ